MNKSEEAQEQVLQLEEIIKEVEDHITNPFTKETHSFYDCLQVVHPPLPEEDFLDENGDLKEDIDGNEIPWFQRPTQVFANQQELKPRKWKAKRLKT